jgi:hypothetical protein
MTSHRPLVALAALAALTSCGPTVPARVETPRVAGASPENPRKVRVVYLVSADRRERPEYTRAIAAAITDLQGWYARELSGSTFTLSRPVVEAARSDKPADWFYGNPNGSREDDWGYNNAFDEAARLVGARKNDPYTTWVIYSDGPGSSGRAGSGVAVLPEDDLLGLVGRHPTQPDPKRWVAGLGHELGHAFGLPHPEDTARHADAIMWTGIYGKYPDATYLTPRDKLQLWRSPFFMPAPPSERLAVLRHARGAFERRRSGDHTFWIERDAAGEPRYTFRELREEGGEAIAYDRGRGFTIALPLGGGRSRLSTDRGASWRPLYEVR